MSIKIITTVKKYSRITKTGILASKFKNLKQWRRWAQTGIPHFENEGIEQFIIL